MQNGASSRGVVTNIRDLAATIFFVAATIAMVYVAANAVTTMKRMNREMDNSASRAEQVLREHLLQLKDHERLMQGR